MHAIVLAGGSGTRLRELTESITGRATPKQFCRFGGVSLLQETVRRIAPVASRGLVVVGPTWAHVARVQMRRHPGFRVLPQPQDRGTGPGVLLPLARILRREPEATVLVTPADHAVRDGDAFREGILRAERAVRDARAGVVLLAVEAAEPRTDYGWIVPGADIGAGLRAVDRFVEKPPADEATRLHAAGALWNTMVLVARATALRDLFSAACPDTLRFLEQAAARPPGERTEWLRRCYHLLGRCDFSRDVLGPARGAAVHAWPRSLGWADLGTPERLLAWLRDPNPARPPALS